MDLSNQEDGPPRRLYRLNSNHSATTVFEEVEMAHDELFSGPVAESLPTSTSAFAHRRARADSITSFTYYNEDVDESPFRDDYDQSSIFNIDDVAHDGPGEEHDTSEFNERQSEESISTSRRHSAAFSIASANARLLRRDSATTTGSGTGFGRLSQKIYLANEDLTIAVAGFRSSRIGTWTYRVLCIVTCGLAYLFFRWLPRYYVTLVGSPCAMSDCEWTVVENQWGQMDILQVETKLYGQSMSSVFGTSEKSTIYSDYDDDPILPQLRLLNYRYMRFCFHPLKDRFVMFNGWLDPAWTDVRSVRAGIDSDDKAMREIVFGANLIDIEQKSTGQLLVDEVLHPFYVFQLASLTLWSLDSYYSYAICIFVISVASITSALVETRATMKRLREVSRFECDVRILRNGFWKYVSSSDLVPGDVYEVSDPSLTQFPSDSLLLSGDCIVNESMLTGESVPVSKIPATDQTLQQLDLAASSISSDVARHFLFSGTKIIRARRPHEDQDGDAVALALVLRTGFNTTKGSLVRSMLFPKPSGFSFYRDSFRYVSVMAFIAMLGFVASFFNFIRLGLAWHTIIVRALDLITIAVPPALPATLTIGTNFALSRLKKKQIYCISPQRVNVAGKVDIMCFDKTGTLTEEGLDVFGLRVVERRSKTFSEVLSSAQALISDTGRSSSQPEDLRRALHTMATCHSLRLVDGELVGDPLDLKMFDFTGWSFQESNHGSRDNDEEDHGGLAPSIARPPPGSPLTTINGENRPVELGVLKSFEFVSQLRRASVVVRQFGSQSGDIFVKGAPECMKDICRPESFPSNYEEILAFYTHGGYRVIGCAARHIKKLSWVKAQKLTREDAERDLDFLGFIIFENKLKPSTAAVLYELNQSNIGTVMVTGDNILTAISVARESGLVHKTAHCFVPHFAESDNKDSATELRWESIDNPYLHLDNQTLLPLPAPPHCDASLAYDITNIRNYSLAVTGEVFRWMVDYAPPRLLNRMLVSGKIYARMSPDEKHELVERLQGIGYSCGFCGDGANDCGALKAADIGISLSEAEASVAAPFTSRIFDIRCVPRVIREGRAALVTSFSCFKYMSMYSAIQFTTVSFLYATASNLGDYQFLYIDVVLILPIAVFMSWAEPASKLSTKRPTANLVSRKVLVPLLGQMCICIAIQAIAYIAVRRQSWYIPPRVRPVKSNIKNSENTTLFLVSLFEYIFAGVVLNAGPPFRKPFSQNWPFVSMVLVSLILTIYLILGPDNTVKKIMQLTKTSWDFDLVLIALGFAYFVLSWTCESFIFRRMSQVVGVVKERITGKAKIRKEFKMTIEAMRQG